MVVVQSSLLLYSIPCCKCTTIFYPFFAHEYLGSFLHLVNTKRKRTYIKQWKNLNLILQGLGDLSWTQSSSLRSYHILDRTELSFPYLLAFEHSVLFSRIPVFNHLCLKLENTHSSVCLSLEDSSSRKQPPPSKLLISLFLRISSLLKCVPRRLPDRGCLILCEFYLWCLVQSGHRFDWIHYFL